MNSDISDYSEYEYEDEDDIYDEKLEMERQRNCLKRRFYGVSYKEGMDSAVDAAVQPGFDDAFKKTAPEAFPVGQNLGRAAVLSAFYEKFPNLCTNSSVKTKCDAALISSFPAAAAASFSKNNLREWNPVTGMWVNNTEEGREEDSEGGKEWNDGMKENSVTLLAEIITIQGLNIDTISPDVQSSSSDKV